MVRSDGVSPAGGAESHGGADLATDVVRFAAVLRDSGIPVGSGQVTVAIRSLTLIDLRDRRAFYAALRAVLLDGHAHEPSFAVAFDRFWLGKEPARPFPLEVRDILPRPRGRPPADSAGARGPSRGSAADDGATQPQIVQPAGDSPGVYDPDDRMLAYTALEHLRVRDFSRLSPEELDEVRRLVNDMRVRTPLRRTRRTRPASHGRLLDMRMAMRYSLRHAGEPIVLPRRRRLRRPRPVVVICDVSGSMERYSRLLLRFLHATSQHSRPVESFVFSTRLTRVTHALRRRDPDRALDDVHRQTPDIAGGTRIGAAIASFNRRWARRVTGSGAIVLIISDGWDRGDSTQLAVEMGHLHRSCYRLIWLNPLLGSPTYRPLTRGMQAALPHIDRFLPAHSLASLEAMARLIEDLDD